MHTVFFCLVNYIKDANKSIKQQLLNDFFSHLFSVSHRKDDSYRVGIRAFAFFSDLAISELVVQNHSKLR